MGPAIDSTAARVLFMVSPFLLFMYVALEVPRYFEDAPRASRSDSPFFVSGKPNSNV